MALSVHDEVFQRITHELLHTNKTEDQIIDGIVLDTYLNKYEASLIYFEVLENIIKTIRTSLRTPKKIKRKS